MKIIDPKTVPGLSSRVVLEEDGDRMRIVINRKSRIIMKDGERIAEMAGKIKKVYPDKAIVLATTAPVCGKTRPWLEERGITVDEIN